MAKNIKGPAIFLAQFAGDTAPFNSLARDLQMGGGARLQGRADPELGRPHLRSQKGGRVEGLLRRGAAASRRSNGIEITELSTHLQGQLVAVHPAYDEAFDAFAPAAVHGKPEGAAEMGGRPGDRRRQGLAQTSA